jgi:2-polyprenyl-3-methyl-5-hydroxy-6-metoxy-1,4-benzoquinol methylase
MTDLEHVSCAVCNGTDSELVGTSNGNHIVRCRRCGLCYVDPRRRPEVSKERDEAYYSVPGRELSPQSHWDAGSRGAFQATLEMIRKQVPFGRVLDIGAGGGYFLQAMRQAGYEVEGFEPSAGACEFASQHFGLRLKCGALATGLFSPDYFQIVTILNVLEHTPNPAEVLSIARTILSANGLLVITVPNLLFGLPVLWIHKILGDSVFGHDYRRSVSVFHVPDHLYLFSPATLRALLQRAGFTDITVFNAVPVTNPGKRFKNWGKWFTYQGAQVLFRLSGGSLVLSYSMTALARRPG